MADKDTFYITTPIYYPSGRLTIEMLILLSQLIQWLVTSAVKATILSF